MLLVIDIIFTGTDHSFQARYIQLIYKFFLHEQ